MIRRLPQQTASLLKNKVVLPQPCAEKDLETAKRQRLIALLEDDSKWKSKSNGSGSRAIVFVTSRRRAEELAQLINEQGVVNGGKRLIAEAFHAGLPAEVKTDVYERFRTRSEQCIDVLCATSAFGMGMDVGNIHLVVHFGPPASLEDYIQEIGRAARSEDDLQAANLPAATACLVYGTSDFEKMRARIYRDLLSDMDLQTLWAAVQSEFNCSTNQFPVAGTLELARLVRKCPRLNTTKVRTGLYWLERLGRIKLGCRVPVPTAAAAPARKLYLPLPAHDHERYEECLACLPDQEWPLLNAALRVLEEFFAPLPRSRPSAVHSLPHAGLSKLLAEPLAPSAYSWLDADQRAHRMKRDQDRLAQRGHAIVRLVAGFGICSVTEQLDGGHITYQVRPRNRNWRTALRHLPQIVKNVLDFIVRSQQPGEPAFAQRTGGAGRTAAQNPEPAQPGEVDGLRLLHFVQDETPDVRINRRSIGAVLRFLRDLDYIDRADTFFPLAYEATLLSNARLNLGEPTPSDKEVLDELKEQARLRIWRLAALEAVPCLAHQADALESFLETYFKSASADSLRGLLEAQSKQGSGQGLDKVLRQARADAFSELLNGGGDINNPPLSLQQAKVCTARVDQDLLINAGPGAGKTKTLLARLAFLIHEEHVSPNLILVLAFTRAVVDELRGRLRKLFADLGYSSYVQKLPVQTFHSFALSELRRIRQESGVDQTNTDFDQPITLLVNTLTQDGGLRKGLADRYQYIFVDEFQDVHGVRYDLLKLLAGAESRNDQPPANRSVHFVMALDDDQAIFDDDNGSGSSRSGSSRNGSSRNGSGDPRHSLDDFCVWARPESHCLTINFRSARRIVEASQDIVLNKMARRLKQGPENRLQPHRAEEGFFKQVDFTAEQGDFAGALVGTLVDEVRTISEELSAQRRGAAPMRSATIAILTPTNRDVYRIKRALQTAFARRNPDDPVFTYLVQGTESKFHLRRDVAYLRDDLAGDRLRKKPVAHKNLERWLSDQLRESRYRYWPGQDQHPERNELWYLGRDFADQAGTGTTFGDFAAYLREVSRNGDYLQTVAKQQAADESAPIRILLSTIHRVKGLEFPVVILPSSEAFIRSGQIENALRVLYVGMTRAENTLVFVRGPREDALLNRQAFERRQSGQPNGLTVKPDQSDLYITFFGTNDRRARMIENDLMPGSDLRLVRDESEGKSKYKLYLPDRNFFYGILAGKPDTLAHCLLRDFPEAQSFRGLEVAGIYRRYAEQDKKSPKADGSLYYDDLTPQMKERGYYHIVEICGFVQPVP